MLTTQKTRGRSNKMALENWGLRSVVGAQQEVTGSWREVHNGKLHTSYSSFQYNYGNNTSRIRGTGYINHKWIDDKCVQIIDQYEESATDPR
jgi:hypothetical protein